jgi:hypothetical protein
MHLFNFKLTCVLLCSVITLFSGINSFATPITVTEDGNSYNIAWTEGTPTTINIYITPGILSDDDVNAFYTGCQCMGSVSYEYRG